MDPPEEVVRELFRGRLLERTHADALRVDALEDVPDHAVLPARIHPLEDDEEAASSVGVEQLLEVVELRPPGGEQRLPLPLPRGPGGSVLRVAMGEVDGHPDGKLQLVEVRVQPGRSPSDGAGGAEALWFPRTSPRVDSWRISGNLPWAARMAGWSPPGPRRM